MSFHQCWWPARLFNQGKKQYRILLSVMLAGGVFLGLMSSTYADTAKIWRPCMIWLQNKLAPAQDPAAISAILAQGRAYLQQVYRDHLTLGQKFSLPQARAQALARFWPQEQAFVDDFLPAIKNFLQRDQHVQEKALAGILQEADHNLLELAGGELWVTLKIFTQLEKDLDCLRLRSVPEVLAVRTRINQLFLNLQEEQATFWPDLEKRSLKWPQATNGHHFTMALRSFMLLVQYPMLALQQQVRRDNLIAVDDLIQGLQRIEQQLATYPRFMANYLATLPASAVSRPSGHPL
jgi:hypothetical protein